MESHTSNIYKTEERGSDQKHLTVFEKMEALKNSPEFIGLLALILTVSIIGNISQYYSAQIKAHADKQADEFTKNADKSLNEMRERFQKVHEKAQAQLIETIKKGRDDHHKRVVASLKKHNTETREALEEQIIVITAGKDDQIRLMQDSLNSARKHIKALQTVCDEHHQAKSD